MIRWLLAAALAAALFVAGCADYREPPEIVHHGGTPAQIASASLALAHQRSSWMTHEGEVPWCEINVWHDRGTITHRGVTRPAWAWLYGQRRIDLCWQPGLPFIQHEWGHIKSPSRPHDTWFDTLDVRGHQVARRFR